MFKLIDLRKKLTYTLSVMAVTIILVGIFYFWLQQEESEPVIQPKVEITATQVEETIVTLGDLITAGYLYTNMGRFEAQNSFYGYTVPFTTKTFILSYSGEIKAGISLSEIKVTLTPSAVVVTIPYSKILSHEIDYDSFEIYDESKNIFNPITLSDYTAFFADEHHKMEEKALSKGLLDGAREEAIAAISTLITSTGLLENTGKTLLFN